MERGRKHRNPLVEKHRTQKGDSVMNLRGSGERKGGIRMGSKGSGTDVNSQQRKRKQKMAQSKQALFLYPPPQKCECFRNANVGSFGGLMTLEAKA